MTISSSNGYKSAVYAPVRETRARVTINMSAFSQVPAQTFTLSNNYVGKVALSGTANPHKASARGSANITDAPSLFTEISSQTSYDQMAVLDGTVANTTNSTNTFYAKQLFSFSVFEILERQFGRWIWGKRNPSNTEKIAVANAIITNYSWNWTGRGTNPSGNQASISMATGYASDGTGTPSYTTPVTNTSASLALLNLATSSVTGKIDINGFVHLQAYSNVASNGTTASNIYTDYVELVVSVSQTTNRTFDDSRIVSVDTVEETDILNITSPANQMTIKLDNTDNLFNFISLSNLQTIVASRPKFYLEFGVVLADGVTVEWIPMGVFYMDNWQQDTGGMTVTFTCHDLLWILANSSFPITNINNLGTALVSLLTSVGITDYVYDPLIDTIDGGNRPTRYTNCRQLLQNLAVGTGLTLYQDRLGTLKIVKFNPIAQSTSYTTFTTSQTVGSGSASLFGGYPSTATVGGMPKTVSKQDTDGGMRAITIDQQFEIPQVTLEPSVYQINVNVYKNNPSDPSYDIYTYTNPNLSGNAGESFTIDNSLITTTANAQAIATRFFNELNFNLVYVARWRQNPVLEATDVVMINDTETSAKQARIIKQEYSYQGFLTGTSESRGGL